MSIELSIKDFSSYPPEGKKLALAHLALLRELPAALLPVFLLDLKKYDWKFPVEQQEVLARLEFIQANPSALAAFRTIKFPPAIDRPENIRAPQRFLEEMSAFLWSSLQMDAYRRAADQFVGMYNAEVKPVQPTHPRLVMICIGREASIPSYALFQKLRDSGQIWTNVRTEGAAAALLDLLQRRSKKDRSPYAHWYVDGGSPLSDSLAAEITQLLYPELAPVNTQVLAIMTSCIKSGSGPEVLQAKLGEVTRSVSSAGRVTADARLQQFVVSVLTDGAGTQIFSTTFVQWTTREILRRARPATILARYAPRQRQKPFNSMVADALKTNDLDPDGSLEDADMGAWYAFLELKRLPGAEHDRFLVWFEGHSQAFISAPGVLVGTEAVSPISMSELLARLQTETES